MYKLIPGNSQYKISLDGKILNSDNSACTLNIINNNVIITLYGEEKTVNLSWLGLMAHYEVSLPKRLRKLERGIWFADVLGTPLKPQLGKRMVFNKPIHLTSTHRIVPEFTDYAVNSNGRVIEVSTLLIVPSKAYGNEGYPVVWVKDNSRNKFRSVGIHRLVALAWVNNPDYSTNIVVNHKDGNKGNPHRTNLEWTNYTGNALHAFENGLRKDNTPCKVRDIYTKGIVIFPSVSKACDYMKVPVTQISRLMYKKKAKLVADRFEVKLTTDKSPWFYQNLESPVCAGRYKITCFEKDGSAKTFHDVRSFTKELKVWNAGGNIKTILDKARTLYPNTSFELQDSYNRTPIQAFNVITEEIKEAESAKKLGKLIDRTYTSINTALALGESQVSQGFAYRYKTDKVWNKDFTTYISIPKCILATNQITDEAQSFNSLRATANYFKIDRSVIKRCLETKKPHRDWNFEEINELL